MNNAITSILAGLGGMFGWGTSDFFAGISSKKLGHYKTFFWSQFAGLASASLIILFFSANFAITTNLFILLSIASVFYSVAYLYFYKGFELGNVSVISASINLWPVFTMIFAYIFLGQRLSTQQSLGILLILSGITLVALKWNDFKNQKFSLLAGVKEAIFASFLSGIFWNLSDVISEKIGWLPTTIYIKVGVVIFLLIFSFLKRNGLSLNKISTQTKLTVLLVGVLEAIGVASVNWGLTVGDVILITPISSALSVITITMAIIFLKEKITKTQAMGILFTIVGIIMTAI
jgi:drug/metabolite transporter (DMT)-like permease